ncbi:hypothetical protein CR194_05900 [Salipaludibacillus keqinensis]|uniref:Uncharacterized protein n=1 Tax=Salipaludibacillus keqinensis TaxID=2045207 RepID=A0A323TLR1_9BACI|nr:hypothetical protein CR194_05900 [Salipaludibacillus keqinensis]
MNSAETESTDQQNTIEAVENDNQDNENGGLNDSNSNQEENNNEIEDFEYEEYDEAVAYQSDQEERVNNIILKQHNYLNDKAGWGGAESFDHEELQNDEDWQALRDDINYLKNDGFAESKILIDMKNAHSMADLVENGDSMALRFLHRIFHDLDMDINETDADRYWNVTHAFGSGNNHEIIYAYLTGDQE